MRAAAPKPWTASALGCVFPRTIRPAATLPYLLAAALVASAPGVCRGQTLGDVNCDGAVNVLDVSPFVLAMLDSGAFMTAYPTCDIARADMNGSGVADGLDIALFVNLLIAPPAQEIVLRDSIGPDSATTQFNSAFSATHVAGASWITVPITVTADEPLQLREFRAIIAQTGPILNWSGFDYVVRVFSPDALSTNPVFGDITNHTYDVPTVGPTPFGLASSSIGQVTSYEVGFDLAPLDIILSSGQTVSVSLEFYSLTGTGQSGSLGYLESTEVGISDRQYSSGLPPPYWRLISSSSSSHHSGRVGITIVANPYQ